MAKLTVSACLTAFLLFAAFAWAQTPTFTLSASNTTMPPNGVGTIPYTLTSVGGFSGTVLMSCVPPDEPANVTLPFCEVGGPVIVVGLNANETVKQSFELLASLPVPDPARFHLRKQRGGVVFALAGAVLLGLGVGRRRSSWSCRIFLAFGLLCGLTVIGACGGNQKTLTPGNYLYTITATEQGSASPITTTATLTVTVPPGVVVKSS